MANDSITIVNAEDGTVEVREMTDSEQAQRNAEIGELKAKEQAKQEAEELSWRTKIAAYEKLGLTKAEIETIAPTPEWLLSEKTILGGN
jgi:hypothetical protein